MPDSEIESSPDAAGRLLETTTASLLTGAGRSAIAVIAVAGPDAAQVIQQCFTPATRRRFAAGQIRYGVWHGDENCESVSGGNSPEKSVSDAASESVVVVPVTESEFEIHCHGGLAATERILQDLKRHDVAAVDWQNFRWKQAEPLLIRESQKILSGCLTARTAAIAMDQVRGALHQWCQKALSKSILFDSNRKEAQEMLAFGKLSVRLNDRFRVVLAGRPNVGKSSLINAIVGYDRSITLDHPGTTRDVLHAETVIDGWPIQLSDTAGIRDGEGEIEREGIRRANRAIEESDLVIWVTTPQQLEPPNFALSDANPSPAAIQVLNKADLAVETMESCTHCKTVATTGQGVQELMAQISRKLIPAVPPSMTPLPINPRQYTCLEKIAEAGDRQTQQQWIRHLEDSHLASPASR